MTHFRIRYVRRGGHTHLDVFAGKARELTHGKCGDLCMTNEEFDDFRASFENPADCEEDEEVEFIDHDQDREDNGQFGVGA